jgi:PAS domain S-box-containing protein
MTSHAATLLAELEVTSSLLETARTQLHQHEQLLQAIFDGALDALLLADDRGAYVNANPAACALFGLPRDQLLGCSIAQFSEPQLDVAAQWERFREAGSMEGQFVLVRADGERRYLDFRATANILPGLHLSVLRDMTAQKHAHDAQARLAAIVESSEDAIVSTSLAGRITSWNLGAERLFGWAAAEAIGEDVALLIPAEQREAERYIMEGVARGARVDSFDTKRLRKDGSPVEVSLTISPMRDSSGAIIGASEVARDLTERRRSEAQLRRTEEQLRQAQKLEAIGALAGGVAHDFNNMLSVILGYASLVLEELEPDEGLRGLVTEIARAGERATALTRQLLAFSRQQVLQPRVLDLNQVVRDMEKMLRRLLGAHIELSQVAAPALGRVYADPSQVEQILLNLVVNARDAMPRGGTLTIETANVELDAAHVAYQHDVSPGPYVLLAISDTGVGMAGGTRERIFEPFFTTKELGKGTGLGLATVFGIVKQSRGHLWVHSEPGQGSTFKIYLPRTARAVENVSERPAPQTLRGTETILLVEDEEQVRVVTRAILRRYGYNVLDAQNGGEAFLICEQYGRPIDLLLTDVVMPRMSGTELAARLVAMRPALRVVYLSGYTEGSVVHPGVLDVKASFLQKPITPDLLCRTIREVLDVPSA